MSESQPIKLCLFCRHCEFDEGWGGSEQTPGYNATIKCHERKDYCAPFDRIPYLKWCQKAETCPDYAPDLGWER